MMEQLFLETTHEKKPKDLKDTLLYKAYPHYGTQMFKFVMECERIDTKSEEFADIAFDIKRRNVSSALPKVLTSANVVIGISEGKALPKAFKVFVSEDPRDTSKRPKVFIDVSECVDKVNGVYTCRHIEWLISYLVASMSSYLYELAPERLINNQVIVRDGAAAYSKLFSYILDRAYKTTTLKGVRKRVEYMCALYYQANLLGKNYNDPRQYDTMAVVAMKVAGIDRREAQATEALMPDNVFDDLNIFLENIGLIFGLKKLSTSGFVDDWMYAFGTGTTFAIEYFPAFSMMMTNTYLGGFIDQQLTIEKITGQNMVTFTKKVIEIGAGATT